MKKLLSITLVGMALLASSTSAFAVNKVSEMATTKGGQHVAECAQKMDKGISECLQMLECKDGM
ncbi:MAG TPA: hypothetical protein VLM81_05470 [Peptostreptococcaceae bacterium]|nr:hypothetical protein [Peptostreptococcaceae bacterium]